MLCSYLYMSIYLSHMSALYYLRSFGANFAELTRYQRAQFAPAVAPDVQTVEQLVKAVGLPLPLEVTVCEASARIPSEQLRYHVRSAILPRDCFSRISSGIVVSSPEHCFLQMATRLSLVELIELGYEFCGRYSLPGLNESLETMQRGFYDRPPLTNVKRLLSLVQQMKGTRGQVKAMKALKYIVDNSASPVETKLAILLTLPYKLGGRALPLPVMNASMNVSIDGHSKSATRLFCDLFWPNAKVAVEYDSDMYHTGATRIASDSRRRALLLSAGVSVITVTNTQLRNANEFETIAKLLATNLGVRLRSNENPGFPTAHRQLRMMLFSNNYARAY